MKRLILGERVLLFSFLVLAPLIFTGCGGGGGSSGGGTEASTEVTVNLENVGWAAYQTGDGEAWQSIDLASLTDNTFTFNTDESGKYGIAVKCIGEDEQEVEIYQFTTSEITDVDLECTEDASSPHTVSGAVSGAEEGSEIYLSMNGSMSEIIGNGNYTLNQVEEGLRDLVVVEAKNDESQKVYFSRDITVNGDLTGVNVNFSDTQNTYDVIANAYTVNGGEGSVLFCSKNRTVGLAGSTEDIDSIWDDTWYTSNGGLVEGDFNIFSALSSDELVGILRFDSALNTPAAVNLDTAAVNRLDSVTTDGNAGTTFSGLNYTKDDSSPQLRGYEIEQEQDGVARCAMVSAGWLEGVTSYTMPDLSDLNGWNAAWDFVNGSEIVWNATAILATRGWQEMFENATDITINNGEEDELFFVPIDGLEVYFAMQEGSFIP